MSIFLPLNSSSVMARRRVFSSFCKMYEEPSKRLSFKKLKSALKSYSNREGMLTSNATVFTCAERQYWKCIERKTQDSELFLNTTDNMKCSSRYISTSTLRRRKAEDDQGFSAFKSPFSRDFGKFEKVMPTDVSNVQREIPKHIQKPDYWKTGYPTIQLGPINLKVEIKTEEAIQKMRKACALAKKVLSAAAKEAKPGVTTEQIDDFVFNYTIEHGAYPSPLNYQSFPKSVCTSINNVACHGIPDQRKLVDGDIINIDVMVYLDGYHGDCSETVLVGNVDTEGRKLVKAAQLCLERGIMVCAPGVPFERIGQTIEDVAEEQGFTVIPAFTGHGIGKQIHGPPDIYHIDYPYKGKMMPGMTFTIEPVVGQGMEDVVILEDGWTAVTLDGSRTAQFEHTILITENGSEILTLD